MTANEQTSQPAEALLLPFAELCQALAATTKKLAKRALMAEYLATLHVDNAARAALWLAGAPFAETDPRKLQVGGSTLAKAVAELAHVGSEALSAAYRRYGDLGDAAYELLSALPSTPPGSLTLAAIETALAAMAEARGPAAKLSLLLALLGRATPLEARYLIKLASGDMRTGVKQSLVEEAIATAYNADAPSVRCAVMLNGNLAEVVRMAAAGTLDAATMRLFHPLGFMLASPVDSVEEAMARFAEEVALEAKAAPATATLDLEASQSLPAEFSIAQHAPQALRAAQLEDKYDGMRAQLHCGDPAQPGRVGLFSRNREDIAESFPELIEAFASFGEAAILDGEILAWQPLTGSTEPLANLINEIPAAPATNSIPLHGHPERSDGSAVDLAVDPAIAPAADPAVDLTPSTGRALPFSSLQQRLGRKRVTPAMRQQAPVVFMAFDLLYHAGELLLDRPLAERRARLVLLVAKHTAAAAAAACESKPGPASPGTDTQQTLFAPAPDTASPQHPDFPRLRLASAVQLADAAQLDAAYLDARARGNEGVMLKASGSLYQPGRRGLAWLKLKRELATLDVVITGAEFGNGRRAGVLSDYTFAVRNPAPAPGEPALLNVGKAYSGLTDLEIEALSRQLMDQTLEDYGHFRTVEPTIVLEVAFNNVMRSDRHASGFALRFPRILRIRDDKPPAEIDTLARVAEIYTSQPDKPVED